MPRILTREQNSRTSWRGSSSALTRPRSATLLHCSWEALHRIVGRVVADHVDERRLEGLYRIGVGRCAPDADPSGKVSGTSLRWFKRPAGMPAEGTALCVGSGNPRACS